MVEVYQVGGSVRDELLGLRPHDLDYTVVANSYEEMLDYVRARGTVFLESPQYFTVRARVPGLGAADFVLARRDGAYTDGRRPDAVTAGSLFDDLSRRDFTVNAMARSPVTRELVDPFGGYDDLNAMVVRCVGNARDRFDEDSLRMLRALRFAVVLGFTLHDDVVEALDDPAMVARLAAVSTERVREEVSKMFMADTMRSLELFERFPLVREAVFASGRVRLDATMRPR